MTLIKKIGEGLLYNGILITIVDITNNFVSLNISHNENKEMHCKEHESNAHISIIFDSSESITAVESDCEDKQIKISLKFLVNLGFQALDVQQFDFAKQIFLLAKEKGYKFANRYLAVIEKRLNGDFL